MLIFMFYIYFKMFNTIIERQEFKKQIELALTIIGIFLAGVSLFIKFEYNNIAAIIGVIVIYTHIRKYGMQINKNYQ